MLYAIAMGQIAQIKTTNSLSEPPFGKVTGDVCTSSIARWKARGRLPIHDTWTFFSLALTVQTL